MSAHNIHLAGIAVSRGIVIGRALTLARAPLQVEHHIIPGAQVPAELERLQRGFDLAIGELRRVQQGLADEAAYADLHTLLDAHAMLLEDEALQQGAAHYVRERHYNAEWALMEQLAELSRDFDAMDDSYLRERKADLEQLVARVLQCMRLAPGVAPPPMTVLPSGADASLDVTSLPPRPRDALPQIVVAHDLAPADMLHFRRGMFAGFVTDAGSKASHTAIVARSLDIPAVVGMKDASARIAHNDLLIVHADAGLVILNPDEATLQTYRGLQAQMLQARQRQQRLRYTPAITRDGCQIELLANVELPADCEAAVAAGAVGVGLFRSEFLFLGRHDSLPGEEEQYRAYRAAIQAMQGLPVTIRTIDIGADKLLEVCGHALPSQEQSALGLRAIRWSLANPELFRTQLRALLRAAVHGPLNILFPMLSQMGEVRQTLELLEQAREELRARNVEFGPVRLGAMVEVPAAALMLRQFLPHFDFISIGSNDLAQYTLAVDRAQASVAHLFDATHPAVLHLIANVIAQCKAQGKSVCLCGEIAGDPHITHLLLGLGLQSFSMNPAQLLAVKERILQADTGVLAPWAQQVLELEDTQAALEPSG